MKNLFPKYNEFLILLEKGQVFVNAEDKPAQDVLGSLNTDDPKYTQKINAIKNTLAEEAFNQLIAIVASKLPSSARDAGARKVGDLVKKYYTGGPENIASLNDLLKNSPLEMTAASLSGRAVDPFASLSSYYSSLPTAFFQDLFKEQPGDMGPGELMFSAFTTFEKGTKGDLFDPIGKVAVEVKAKNGRLSGIGKMANGVDALDKINAILGTSIKSRGISKSTLEKDVYPVLKEKKLSVAEADAFVMALSQIPDSFSTHRVETGALVHRGISSPDQLSDLFLAIQLISYADYAGFDSIMIFTDGNTACQVIRIKGASLAEIMGYGAIISYSGWATGQESAIGVARRKR